MSARCFTVWMNVRVTGMTMQTPRAARCNCLTRLLDKPKYSGAFTRHGFPCALQIHLCRLLKGVLERASLRTRLRQRICACMSSSICFSFLALTFDVYIRKHCIYIINIVASWPVRYACLLMLDHRGRGLCQYLNNYFTIHADTPI